MFRIGDLLKYNLRSHVWGDSSAPANIVRNSATGTGTTITAPSLILTTGAGTNRFRYFVIERTGINVDEILQDAFITVYGIRAIQHCYGTTPFGYAGVSIGLPWTSGVDDTLPWDDPPATAYAQLRANMITNRWELVSAVGDAATPKTVVDLGVTVVQFFDTTIQLEWTPAQEGGPYLKAWIDGVMVYKLDDEDLVPDFVSNSLGQGKFEICCAFVETTSSGSPSTVGQWAAVQCYNLGELYP